MHVRIENYRLWKDDGQDIRGFFRPGRCFSAALLQHRYFSVSEWYRCLIRMWVRGCLHKCLGGLAKPAPSLLNAEHSIVTKVELWLKESKFKSLYKWIVLSSRINPPGTRSYPPVTGAEASALAWWAQVNILERVRRIKAVCPVHKETKWFQTLSERYWGLIVKKKSKRRAQRNISTARTRLKWERALWGRYKDPSERRLHYITRCFTPPP